MTVTVSPEGGGNVTLDDFFKPSSYPATYDYAVNVQSKLEAIPSPGYSFVRWSGAASGTDNVTTITMTCDTQISAVFAPTVYKLEVSVSPGIGGEVELNIPQPTDGYPMGTEVSLNAIARKGYKFSNWSGAISSSENPLFIFMDSDKEVQASFFELSHQFAWWWVIAGVVIIGLIAYYLVVRK